MKKTEVLPEVLPRKLQLGLQRVQNSAWQKIPLVSLVKHIR